MVAPVHLLITGAAGRMGRCLLELASEQKHLRVVAALERPGSRAIGMDTGLLIGRNKSGVIICDDLRGVDVSAIDVAVDFTRPQVTHALAKFCRKAGCAMVVGTTGLDAKQSAYLRKSGQFLPLLWTANFSVGVYLLQKLALTAATMLGKDADIEIIEAHHRYKVDAPSGTALQLGQALAYAQGRDLQEDAVHGRKGRTGTRPAGSIGFHAVRGGDMAGEHHILFAMDGQQVKITHRAFSRTAFATGALQAAAWLAGKPPGLYSMDDLMQAKDELGRKRRKR